MKLAVCLYKYFAYGGLARDFKRILEIRRDAGDSIDVYTIEWQGDAIPGFNIIPIEVSGLTNHGRVQDFHRQVLPKLDAGHYDLVIGFNKMPGLDLYYAADPCYLDRVKQHPSFWLKKQFGRVKFYAAAENAVFGQDSQTIALMISSVQRKLFEQHYGTPANRLIDLPPGIDPARKRATDWQIQRKQLRATLKLQETDFLLLMIGSGFKRKGVDYTIKAMAALPEHLRHRTHLYVLGDDDKKPFEKLAQQLNLAGQVNFMGGRDDVPDWLVAADLFLHPARSENTGTVILEAMVAGLPVLVSAACGYAHYVVESAAGECVDAPYITPEFSRQLANLLDKNRLEQLSENAIDYADSHDLYSMPQRVADLIESLAKAK